MSERDLFLAALDIEDINERARFLAEKCGDDSELLKRLNHLLLAKSAAGSFLESPANAAPEFAATLTSPGSDVGATADQPGKDEQAGAVIAGKYTLLEVIGEGGMGSVWRAKQTEPVKRFVAVKLIKAGMDSKQVLARFDAERQALALMDHPNIAKVLDGGIVGQSSGSRETSDLNGTLTSSATGRPYFVMELVKGTPITEYCDANKLTPKQRLELFVQACQAIQHAHQKGIIHRDIKPSNVLVALYDDKPVVKVIDFGVAKATGGTLTEATIDTGFGGVVGTPQYMSPEQATFNNLDIDTRTDVYALGVLLYELLAGSPPFSGDELKKKGFLEILRVVREEEPPRPSTKLSTADALPTLSANRGTEPKKLTGLLRNELDWIVMKALEKDRTRRYETANGFAADVQRYLAGEPVVAHPPSAAYRLKKFVRRNRPQVIAAIVVLLALLVGVVGTTIGLFEAKNQERLARAAAEEERQAKAREAEQRSIAQTNEKLAKDEKAKAERNLAFARKGNQILGSVFLGLDPVQIAESGRPLQDVLRENLSKAVKALDDAAIGDPLEVAALQEVLGASLTALGESRLAIEVFEKAQATSSKLLGPDHPVTAAAINNLANAYMTSDQPAKAVPLFEKSLELTKAHFGPDHSETLITAGSLGSAYLFAGQLSKAVTLLEQTVAKMKIHLDPNHTETLKTVGRLAAAYAGDEQHAKVLPLLEPLIETFKTKLGPNHPDTLKSLINIGNAYNRSGQVARSIAPLEEAVAKLKVKHGPDHPDTLIALINLAKSYSLTNQFGKAIPLYEDSLKKAHARLGPNHPITVQLMHGQAAAFLNSGQAAKGLPMLKDALEKTKATLGPDHPETLQGMRNLALAYMADRDAASAVPLLEDALEKSKALLGPDHPETLRTMSSLGGAYGKVGRFTKAVPLLEEAVTKMKVKIPDDVDSIKAMIGLALVYPAVGEPAKSHRLLKEAGPKSKAILGPNHPETLLIGQFIELLGDMGKADEKFRAKQTALGPKHIDTVLARRDLAQVYMSDGLADIAEQILVEVLKEMTDRKSDDPIVVFTIGLLRRSLAERQHLAPNDWKTFQTQSLLGGALLGQKKYADAEPLLLKGYEGLKAREKAVPAESVTRIPEALDRLIDLYNATKKPDLVKKWQAERAKYPTPQEKK